MSPIECHGQVNSASTDVLTHAVPEFPSDLWTVDLALHLDYLCLFLQGINFRTEVFGGPTGQDILLLLDGLLELWASSARFSLSAYM